MSETEKNESQVQPMKENSAKKNDLKFKIEWPDEDLKTNINEKKEINEILENNSQNNPEGEKKSGSEKEKERQNKSENAENINSNFSEIKKGSIPDINKNINEKVDISNNNDIMEIDEFEKYKNEKNKVELNYRNSQKDKKKKYKERKMVLELNQGKEKLNLEFDYAKKRRQLEDEYKAEKNQLELKHKDQLSKLKQEYKEEKKELTENYEKKMEIIEQNLGNYMSDARKQKEEVIQFLEGSNNLKRRIEKRKIRTKAAEENKFEYLSSKIGNSGCNQKIINDVDKNMNENDEIENGSLCEKKNEDKK